MATVAPERTTPAAAFPAAGRPVAVKLSDEGVPELVGRLVEDTRGVVTAEVELYKSKIAERITAYKAAAVLFAVAGVLGLVGLIALLVGLIMTLATLIGPGFATLIVVGVVLAAAAALGLMGRAKLAPPNTGAPR